ncbi:Protein of unknown function (DUF1682) domain containing protein [Naviculisporaceae sp. PSN 640]
MAQVLNNLFGGGKPTPDHVAAPAGDSDFGDFVEGAEPAPAPITPVSHTLGGVPPAQTLRPYTKWYNVHERYTWSDFQVEGAILLAFAVVLIVHLIGARLNRNKAKKWSRAHAAPLASEFALVGFSGVPSSTSGKSGDELVQALNDINVAKGELLAKEKSLFEFATYATGRANVAFLDVKLTLKKRFNPLTALFENVFAFFFESFGDSADVMEAILYPFDGREAQIVPGPPGSSELRKDGKTSYDGFVWAIVHKERMKQVREDRYDVSLTYTKDHPKLPSWLTVMSESAEITDLLLTPELINAATAAGDDFEYLIVSDQPLEKPTTIEETTPRKRIFLKYRLPSSNDYSNLLPVFTYFLRITDQLVSSAKFRPEVLRKVKSVRDDAIRQIQKAAEDEKAEERKLAQEKAKKAKRDAELKALDAKAQKKYLEKEREKEMKKATKRQTTRA